MDPALAQLLNSGNMSLLLAARIIDLVKTSGADRIEIDCAFDMVAALIPTLDISFGPRATIAEGELAEPQY